MRNVKLRYYLRGIGIGVLVTAVVLGVALQGEEKTLTDVQIRERALELGMVDGDSLVLSDLQGDLSSKKDSVGATAAPDKTQETQSSEIGQEPDGEDVQETEDALPTEETLPAEDTVATEEQPAEDTVATEEQPAEGTVATEEQPAETQITEDENIIADEQNPESRVTGEINDEGDTVTIEIRSGAHSYSVCKVLEDMGLIADASTYDVFLCNNGYSKKIHTGKYLIAIGTSEEEIAKIITGNR